MHAKMRPRLAPVVGASAGLPAGPRNFRITAVSIRSSHRHWSLRPVGGAARSVCPPVSGNPNAVRYGEDQRFKARNSVTKGAGRSLTPTRREGWVEAADPPGTASQAETITASQTSPARKANAAGRTGTASQAETITASQTSPARKANAAGRTGTAIAGLGMTELGKVYGRSSRRLAAEAVRLAVADAGLGLADLDGLLVCPGIAPGALDVGLAQLIGLRDLRLLSVINSYGASAGAAVALASLAITSGSASVVACVFADTPLRPEAPAGATFGMGRSGAAATAAAPAAAAAPAGAATPAAGAAARPEWYGLAGLRGGYGYRTVTAEYALAARRHMAAYGTTSEQFGAISVAQRAWAAGNPCAQFREPITLADHQASRWIVEPLHLLDCCLVSNGAIAVVVTSADRAAGLRKPPVHIWGWGQGHPGHQLEHGSHFGLSTGAAIAGPAAMTMAGITAGDVTMCQIYDCYTYTVLVTLEDYGFCAKGDGGPFAASGALAPGGSMPVNTGGGQLSAYYMWGFTPLSEAVIQARGDGGARQSPASDVILVSGNGGILAHHSTLVLSPHAR